jgi:hypothetical protein
MSGLAALTLFSAVICWSALLHLVIHMGRWSRRPSLRQGNCVPDQDTKTPVHVTHIYKVRPRKDHRGVDLISDALPCGGLWYGELNTVHNAISYAKFFSRSHDSMLRKDGG